MTKQLTKHLKNVFATLLILVLSISSADAQYKRSDDRDNNRTKYQSEIFDLYQSNSFESIPWITLFNDPLLEPQKVIGLYEEKSIGKDLVDLHRRINKRFHYYKSIRGISVNLENPFLWEDDIIDAIKKSKKANDSRSNPANFQFIGQTVSPLSTNVGRIERINFHPTDPNTVWASAPEGGLWRSNDAGTNWTLMDDFWDHMSVGDLVYNTNDVDTVYCATGDHDSWFNLNRGILRSDNGGSTWNIVGLPYSQAQDVHKLIMHPDGRTVIACTNLGIFTSSDHGVTWSSGTLTKDVNDLEFNPGNADIMYASERGGGSPYVGYFHVSTDGGLTWTQKIAPMDSEGQTTQITVSPNNANIAYVGIYPKNVSSFSGIRVMKYDHTAGTIVSVSNPSTTYPQAIPGAWDFRIEVDPSDANHVIYGCVHNYQSFDGGITWAHLPTLHADVHDIKWQTTSGKMWIADDGGLGVSTDAGASWTGFSNLPVMQWAAVASSANGNVMVLGAQDAGNQIDMGGFYSQPRGGGDGLYGAVDPVDSNITYTTVQVGLELNRLDYDPTTQSYDVNYIMNQSIGGNVATWAQQIIIDRDDHNIIYTNYADIWKSTDRGENWTNITNGSFGNSGAAIAFFKQSQSHPDIMYGGITGTSDLRKSTDRGLTWTQIIHPGIYLSYYDAFEIHPTDPNKLYALGSGQVKKSEDGGMTWTNITGSLPSGPFNLAIHGTANDGIYAAGNQGVLYYRDNTLSDWVAHEDGLPNVRIFHLEVLPEINKIRAATWGRGIWEGDTYANSVDPCSEPSPPIVDFQRCQAGTTATIAAAPTGYTIVWFNNGVEISGQTNTLLNITLAGTYTTRYLDDDGTCHSYLSEPVSYVPVGAVSLIGGNGLHFDGVDDQVVIPSNGTLELGNRNFSITFWAKRDGINSADFLIEQGYNNTNKKLHIGFEASNHFKFGFFANDLLTSDKYLDNDWHHWSCVYDHEIASPANNRFIYRDGILVASDRSNAAFSAGGDLRLSWSSSAFKGTVDELIIYGSVLSPSAIDGNMHCPIDCVDSDILLYLPFQEGIPNGNNAGYTLVDYSLYNHTSTMNNFDLNNASSNIVDGLEIEMTGANVVCPDMSWTYSVPNINGATYAWTNPSGWTGTSTSNNITLTPTSTGGTLQCVVTTTCGNHTLSQTVSVNPYCETAFDFDGSDDQINFAEASVGNFGTGDFTIEYWIKTTDTHGAVIAKREGCNCDSWSILIDNGYPRMEVISSDCSGTNLTSTTKINDGEWHHIAVSRSGTTWNLYLDGVLNISSTLSDDINNTNSLHLGYISCGSTWYLDGTVDEVKIWNEAKTATQLSDNRFCTINTIPTNLAFYLPFEDGSPGGDNSGSLSTTDRVTKAIGYFKNIALNNASSNFGTGVDILRYPDSDMDGYGLTTGSSTRFCLTGNYILTGGDCDDTNMIINPDSDEICANGIDDDCDGSTDIWTNKALDFDASSSNKLSINPIDLNGSFTIELWFKGTGNGGVKEILRSQGNSDFWEFGVWDNQIAFLKNNSGWRVGPTIDDGAWHHLLIRYDATTTNVQLWTDGARHLNVTSDINFTSISTSIGANINGDGQKINGSMDEFRIWNSALNILDIQNRFHAKLDGTEAGLSLYYDFDQGMPGGSNEYLTEIKDRSSGTNNGQLINFTLTGSISNIVSGPTYTTRYLDNDSDGFGSSTVWTCGPTTSYVENNLDCDDNENGINPSSLDICGNGVDENCNNVTDENTLSLKFDGNNDHVDLGNSLGNFGTGDFTIETKFKVDLNTTYEAILSKRGLCSCDNFWDLVINVDGKLNFEIMNSGSCDGGTSLNSGIVVNDGNWHHTAVTRKMGVVRLYLDGVLVSQGYATANINNTYNLYIGKSPCNFTNFYLHGEIDEVKIWSEAQTSNHIFEMKDASLEGNETNLEAYYNFNNENAAHNTDNTAQTNLEDITTNTYDGTLIDFALTGTASNWTGNPEVTTIWYADTDTDGFGDPNVSTISCSQPTGYVSNDDDCDDTNVNVNPGESEVCGNMVDENCNGTANENCDDMDLDGFTTAQGDCDDTNPNIYPGAPEICNGIDDNCNLMIDENLAQFNYYQDADGDGFGNPQIFITNCTAPSGYVLDNTDCQDNNAAIFPGATEILNGIDDNCNGMVDEGASGTPVTGIISACFSAIDDSIMNMVNTYNIPGLTIAFGVDEKIQYMRAFGHADLSGTEITQTYHKGRLASLSKAITQAAILKLIDDGLLNFNDKVFGPSGILGAIPYYSGYTDPRINDITVKHLFDHKGGWDSSKTDCFPAPALPYTYTTDCDPISVPLVVTKALGESNPIAKKTLIKFLLLEGLDNDPGTTYAYSNVGYLILGRVISQVSGKDYEQYLQDEIMDPLGMCDSEIAGNYLADKKEREWEYHNGPWTGLDINGSGSSVPIAYGHHNINAGEAHGGWISTSRDILRLFSGTNGLSGKPDFISSSTLPFMATNHAGGWNGCNSQWISGPGGFSIVLIINERLDPVSSAFANLFFHDLPNYIKDNMPTCVNYDLMLVPDTNSDNFSFTNQQLTSSDVSWVVGNGDKRIIVAKANGPVDATVIDGLNYTASAAFGSGTDLGNGNFVMYDGNGSTFNATNLTPGVEYHFRAYEYNQNTNTGNYSLYKQCDCGTGILSTGITVTVANQLCAGDNVNIDYASTGLTFSGGNTFTAQLSDNSGSFASPVILGTLSSTSVNGTINGLVPANSTQGSAYRIRVISSAPSSIGVDNGEDITINELKTWYQDTDGDNFGNSAISQMSCSQPTGYVLSGNDCNDANINVNPISDEICSNAIDDNCDGQVDAITNRALSFDGIDDWISNDLTQVPNIFTLEAWIKVNNSGEQTIASWSNNFNYHAQIVVESGIIRYKATSSSGGNWQTGGYDIGNNTWRHIAVIKNDNLYKIYVDGILRVTTTFNVSLITDDFRLGSMIWLGNHEDFFAGSMDDVRIWSDERTLAEINDNMLFRLDGTEVNLDRYFTMDQGISLGDNSGLVSVKDHSTPASHATLNNFALTGASSNWIDGQAYQFVYSDVDMDGYGGTSGWTCGSMLGLISDHSDCDDNNNAINPTALDICGNGVDENCNGVVDENSMALDFDGVDDHVNFGSTLGNFGTSDFTIEMTVKTNVGGRYILSKRDVCGTGNFWNIYIESNGVLKFEAYDTPGGTGTYSYTGTTMITDDNWHHIAIVRKNGFFSMYIDGVLDVFGNMVTNFNNSAVMEIGDHICDFAEFDFKGSIDELRIWTVARTAAEINSFKDVTMIVSTDMVAYYDFNNPNVQHNASNTGQITLEDRTPNDNDGTLNNFALSGTTSNWIGNPEVTNIWYADTDMDGFGDSNNSTIACAQPTGFVINDDDCDDTNANVNPNQIENITNGIDDDCDGAIDESSSTKWILLDDDINGSCTSTTDCCSNTYCFGLEYTPGSSGQLAAYTTGFLADCLGAANPMTTNSSCVMSDNSSVDVNCMNGNGIKINASGNNGSLAITVGVPVIIHQICMTIQSGESISLDEDLITDISMSIDLDSGGAIDDFPSFISTTANGNAAPVLTMGSIGSCYTTTASAEAAAISAITATDDCSGNVSLSATTSGSCNAMITVTGTDDCGLMSTVMYTTTIDGDSPTTTGSLTDETVEGCDASSAPTAKTTVAELEAMTGDLAILDSCTDDANLMVSSADVSSGTCPLVVTRTYTIKDACNNETTFTHTINVDDNTAPMVTGSLTAANMEGCDASAAPDAKTTVAEIEAMIGDLLISDACTDDANLTITSADASAGTCPLVITRTYTIKDACNNETTLIHTINIDDNTAPVVSGSLTAAEIEGCDISAAPTAKTTVAELEAMTGDLLISDACTIDASLTVTSADASSGTCPLVITRTYTIKDACDNEITLTHTININDDTAPMVTGSLTTAEIEGCDAGVTPDAKTTVAELEPMTGDLLISDACTIDASLTVTSADASSGTCPLVVTRTYTIKDACNNETTLTHTINIDDNIAPTITGSLTAAEIEGCDASATPAAKTTVAELEAMTGDLLISDACTTDASLTVTSADASSGTCPLVVTRTYTIKDACNNETTLTHTINIDDITVPVVTGSLTTESVEGCDISAAPAAKTTVAELEAMTGDLLISDACTDDASLTVTHADIAAGTCPLVMTRIYTINDACNNESTLTHTINIVDTTDPILTMGTIESCYETEAEAISAALAATSGSDNCIGSLTYTSTVTGSCPSMIMITGTDACSNSASVTYSSVITNGALPTESGGPVAIDSSIQISLDAVAPSLPVIVDACNNILQPSTPVVGGTYQEGDCSGTITFTYTYEDCAGSTLDWTFTYNLNCQSINIKGYVEGAYDSGGDSLILDYNKYHLLPGQDKLLSNNISIIIGAEYTPYGHPYDAMPWNYTGNTGEIYGDQSSPNAPANVLSYPSHVFDWVMITIRKDGITAADNVFQCAGWMHKDGEISFPETCPDDLTIDVNAAYYVVLEHRNHMAAMDTATVMDNGAYLDIDFSIADSYAPIFRKGQKEIEAGIFSLYGGNTDQVLSRLSINSVDRTNWKIDQNKIGYNKGDIDQNVSTNSQDETKWKQNQNTTTGIGFD